MKEILLSSLLITALAFHGCGSDSNTNGESLGTTSTGGFVFSGPSDLNVTAGSRNVASFSIPDDKEITYAITGGDSDFYFDFNGTMLHFIQAPTYLEGGNNAYKVEVTATNEETSQVSNPVLFTVNVLSAQPVIITDNGDTVAPVLTQTTFSAVAGTTVSISANETSTYALSGNTQGFSIASAGLLSLPAVAGVYTISVVATDTADTPNSSTTPITVTVTAQEVDDDETLTWSSVDDNRYTWDQADTGCAAMADGVWRLPTLVELEANSETVYALLPESGKGSVVWSSTEATDDNGTERKMGWGYFEDPATGTAQPVTQPYYFICVQ